MKVYGQLIYESGSYSLPRNDEYTQWDSLKDAKQSLSSCWNDIDVDPANGLGVTLILWCGEAGDGTICDQSIKQPDYIFELGPRCGVRKVI